MDRVDKGKNRRGMMRRIAVTVLVLSSVLASWAKDDAKPFPRDEKGNVVFQEVVMVEGVPSAELYARVKLWAAVQFKSAKDAIQLDDSAGGRLLMKGNIFAVWGTPQRKDRFRFTLTIEIKDARYRYTLDHLIRESADPGGEEVPCEYDFEKHPNSGVTKKMYGALRESIDNMLADLKKAMVTSASKGPDF